MSCLGRFGLVDVRDGEGQRGLLLGQQVQGAAFFSPGADIVDPHLAGPGPVSSSAYTLGWLAAGFHTPHARALMIGLGSGAGACQLLWQFPWLELTIIEACPVIRQVATESFPLIGYYQAMGRLHMIMGMAEDVLSRSTDQWDLGLADAYTGETEASELRYLDELADRCADVYLNVIDVPDGRHIAQTVDRLAAAEKPVTGLYRAVDIMRASRTYNGHANWILTTAAQDPAKLVQWQPFASTPGEGGNWGRLNWEPFVRSWQPIALSDHHLQQI